MPTPLQPPEPPTVPGKRSNSGYQEAAGELIAKYESIKFEDLHAQVLRFFPPAPARVMDLGAGSGRDAAALAKRGYDVTAVEPTAALREAGQALHASPQSAHPIVWIDDSLPRLASFEGGKGQFDLMLATAVWMHLDASERETAMQSISALLVAGGRLSMTLRHGPVPPGRRMFEVSGEETLLLARRFGLTLVYMAPGNDAQGRPDVHWTFLVLEKNEAAAAA
jgi:SAM-dependent methyltransferase